MIEYNVDQAAESASRTGNRVALLEARVKTLEMSVSVLAFFTLLFAVATLVAR